MRFTLMIAMLVVAGCLAAPRSMQAAEGAGPAAAPGKDDGKHDAGGHAKKEFKLFPEKADLGVWTLVLFVSLLIGLWLVAWKPMVKSLQDREESILNAMEAAEKARQESLQIQAKMQAEMADASAKVREIMDEARRDAQTTKDQMLADARTEISAERDRLRREIELAKDAALQEIWDKSVTLASAMSAKAVKRSLTDDDHRRLLTESLAEMRGMSNQN